MQHLLLIMWIAASIAFTILYFALFVKAIISTRWTQKQKIFWLIGMVVFAPTVLIYSFKERSLFWRICAVGCIAAFAILFVATAKNTANGANSNFAFSETFKDQYAINPALARPNYSFEYITSFSTVALQNAFAFDAVNYRAKMMDARQFFTRDGFGKFTEALDRSKTIETMQQDGSSNQMRIQASPVISAEGVEDGIYHWKVQIPADLMHLKNGVVMGTDHLIVNLDVMRSDDPNNVKGIGIGQFVALPR